MNRTEFCELLKKIKGDEPTIQLSYKCQMGREVLHKLLSGTVNFFVESAVKVADALNALIVVKNENEQLEINSQTILTYWAQKSQKASGMSVNKFKDEIGMTRVAVTANLNGESKMRIDTFLRWAEITGYQVEVWYK